MGSPSTAAAQETPQTPPSAPSGLTAQREGCGVSLSWDAPQQDSSSVTGYRVLRAKGSAALATLVSDSRSTDTTHSDSAVETGATYSYRVQALRGSSASAQSNLVEVTIPAPPTPTPVAVTSVPIVVGSTTADYFVLYAKHESDGTAFEYPVLVARGEAGKTTLGENVAALPVERYRVEQYSVSNPADVDGDCIDDITELEDPKGMNPVNPAAGIGIDLGAVVIPDRATFETLAHSAPSGVRYLKFVLLDRDSERPSLYFSNTKRFPHHLEFLLAIERDGRDTSRGEIIYDPDLLAPDGSRGLYRYIADDTSFSMRERMYTLLAASLPLLEDNLSLWISHAQLAQAQPDLPSYRASRMNLVLDDDVYAKTSFLALNQGIGYGVLRKRDADERPQSHEVVIYESLPNELPRVAGIISTVPQTPLSHINLRAVQNGVPNGYIPGVLDDPTVAPFLGKLVRYEITGGGWELRAATQAEADAHFKASRPATSQTPERDLSVTEITPLSEIEFDDWKAFGVKAANLAVLRTLEFPAGTVPDGFAIPFYFYDEFMKQPLGEETLFGKKSAPVTDKLTLPDDTKLIDAVKAILAHSKFQTDPDIQEEMLDDLRDAIKDAETPEWIIDALTAMHETYPDEQSLRYRSSTNNEDLPGFNGAGLYDSKTQKPDETEEDGIDKSFKQVLAGLWTYRAFTEREFHRIDHLAAAMGILVHPNFSDELANGVGVSTDPAYGTTGTFYVNTQLGEDLVTNPDALSTPEEILLEADGTYTVVTLSNQVERGRLLMTDAQLEQLRQHLAVIHDHFATLYGIASGDRFAMEVEFKITSKNILAIKQARPWIFPSKAPARPTVSETDDGLTVSVEGPLAGHNGLPFSVRFSFSASVIIPWRDFRDHAVAVTGGRVTKASRVNRRDDRWLIDVTPDSTGDVVLTLEANRPCTVFGALCTFGGRRLSQRLEFTVTRTGSGVTFPPPFTFSSGTMVRDLAENSGTGIDAGVPVAVADDAGNALTYSLGGADAASFDIVSTSGQIRTKPGVTYDHETKAAYFVAVKATDNHDPPRSATTDVTIRITDVDEAPGAPSAPRVSADGSTSLSVSWKAPSNTGPAIDDYDLRYRSSADTDWTDWPHSGTSTSAAITGLDAGTDYDVQVRASNAEGTGPWSAKLAAPANVTVTVTGADDGIHIVTMRWDDPNNTGITGYQIRAKLETYREWGQWWDVLGADSKTTSLVVQVWQEGTFQAQLRAVDDSGPGPSTEIVFSTSDEAPTSTPNAAPVFTDGAGAVRSVAENTDSGRNIGSPVSAGDADGDTLTYTLGGTDAASFSIDGGTGQLRTSAALDHEAKPSYAVTVTASDANGGSATIDVTIDVTDVDEAPGAPPAPAVSAAGSAGLSVSWSAPVNTGPAISDYDVRYRSSADTDWTDWPHRGTSTSAAITGLDAGTDYDVQVRAANAEGTGPWSATGSAGTGPADNTAPEPEPEPTPGALAAPANLTATVVRRSGGRAPNIIELLWDDPDNAEIMGYEYRVKPETGDEWGQWVEVPDADADTTGFMMPLDGRVDHLVELRAKDDNGAGASSEASVPTMPPG